MEGVLQHIIGCIGCSYKGGIRMGRGEKSVLRFRVNTNSTIEKEPQRVFPVRYYLLGTGGKSHDCISGGEIASVGALYYRRPVLA